MIIIKRKRDHILSLTEVLLLSFNPLLVSDTSELKGRGGSICQTYKCCKLRYMVVLELGFRPVVNILLMCRS